MLRNLAVLCLLSQLAPAWPAFAWTEPARGSADRAGMMDALRPHAEWALGAPVEFVIDQLRQTGDVGFAVVQPQRPGGGAIDPAQTPMALRDGQDMDYLDGLRIDALLKREGKTWVAVHWAVGATDAWYVSHQFCGIWAPVLPEACH